MIVDSAMIFDKANKYLDENGYLIVEGAPIARIGIQEYWSDEIGIEGERRIINVYRPPEEVFKPESLASFENKPVTIDHPNDFVGASNWRDLAVGFGRNIRQDDKYVLADLIITDLKAHDEIRNGKIELSNGYSADYEIVSGVAPCGVSYEAIQRDIFGNHIAIVDRARCGSKCSLDSNSIQGESVKKITVDGVGVELDETTADIVAKVVESRDEALKVADEAKAELQKTVKVGDAEIPLENVIGLQMAVKQLEEQIEAVRGYVSPAQMEEIAFQHAGELADTMVEAEKMAGDVFPDKKSCDSIRRAALTKVYEAHKPMIDAALDGKDIATADELLVKTAFKVVAAYKPETKDALANISTNTQVTTDARANYIKELKGVK